MATAFEEDYDELALLVGRATIAWSLVQSTVYLLFIMMLGRSHEEAAALFFSIKTDTGQRDMTLALAEARLKTAPDLIQRYRAAFARVGALAGERNAAIHTLWLVQGETVTPNPLATHHKRLNVEKHREQFARLRESIREVQAEVAALFPLTAAEVSERAMREKAAQTRKPGPGTS